MIPCFVTIRGESLVVRYFRMIIENVIVHSMYI